MSPDVKACLSRDKHRVSSILECKMSAVAREAERRQGAPYGRKSSMRRRHWLPA